MVALCNSDADPNMSRGSLFCKLVCPLEFAELAISLVLRSTLEDRFPCCDRNIMNVVTGITVPAVPRNVLLETP